MRAMRRVPTPRRSYPAVSTAFCGRGARLPLPKTTERTVLRPTTTGNPGNVGLSCLLKGIRDRDQDLFRPRPSDKLQAARQALIAVSHRHHDSRRMQPRSNARSGAGGGHVAVAVQPGWIGRGWNCQRIDAHFIHRCKVSGAHPGLSASSRSKTGSLSGGGAEAGASRPTSCKGWNLPEAIMSDRLFENVGPVLAR
jgi:hypothetical protein